MPLTKIKILHRLRRLGRYCLGFVNTSCSQFEHSVPVDELSLSQIQADVFLKKDCKLNRFC